MKYCAKVGGLLFHSVAIFVMTRICIAKWRHFGHSYWGCAKEGKEVSVAIFVMTRICIAKWRHFGHLFVSCAVAHKHHAFHVVCMHRSRIFTKIYVYELHITLKISTTYFVPTQYDERCLCALDVHYCCNCCYLCSTPHDPWCHCVA
jgi:hypothetical protein